MPAGARVRLRVRARDVLLATERPANLSVQNALRGTVSRVATDEGPYADVQVQIGDLTLFSEVTRDSARRLQLREGCEVYALIKSVAIDSESVTTAPLDLE